MTKVDFLSHNVCFISAFQLASIIMSFYLIAMTDCGKNVFISICGFLLTVNKNGFTILTATTLKP